MYTSQALLPVSVAKFMFALPLMALKPSITSTVKWGDLFCPTNQKYNFSFLVSFVIKPRPTLKNVHHIGFTQR